MKIEDIYKNLCYYDKRNPNNVIDYEDELKRGRKENCSCDNCFYGRDKLAREIIALEQEKVRNIL